MKLPRILFSLAPLLFLGHSASAFLITFGSSADYDSNFYEPTGAFPGGTVWNGAGYLEHNGAASTAMYSPGSTGAPTTGAGGGMEGTTPSFGVGTRIKADFSTSAVNGGNSFGFYVNVGPGENTGYAVLFQFPNSDGKTADFRVFESNSDPSAAGVSSTQLGSTLFFTTTGSFTGNTFYTYQLDLIQNGSNLQFVASLYTTGGTQIGSTLTITDTTSPVLSGEIGLRLNAANAAPSSNVRADNFSVEAIPEPASAGLLAVSGLGLGLTLRRRR